MVNKLILMGRVGQDPQRIDFEDGGYVVKLSVATSNKVKDKEITTWHNVQTSGEIADNVLRFVKKGNLIYTEGPLNVISKETGNGDKKTYVTQHAYMFQLIGDKKKEERNDLNF